MVSTEHGAEARNETREVQSVLVIGKEAVEKEDEDDDGKSDEENEDESSCDGEESSAKGSLIEQESCNATGEEEGMLEAPKFNEHDNPSHAGLSLARTKAGDKPNLDEDDLEDVVSAIEEGGNEEQSSIPVVDKGNPCDSICFEGNEVDNEANEEMKSFADQLTTENSKIKDLHLITDGNWENQLGASCEAASPAHKVFGKRISMETSSESRASSYRGVGSSGSKRIATWADALLRVFSFIWSFFSRGPLVSRVGDDGTSWIGSFSKATLSISSSLIF
ncbi:hypothetical protein U1Q18_017858 [Sarracenia purpurea var. burkii]